jgi:phosphoribosylformylglycinamidine synthase
MNWQAEIRVVLKPSVNDPQGLSIRGALHSLGFGRVAEVRAGKLFVLRLEAADQQQAEAEVEQMCERLLANPVIETYSFELAPVADPVPQTG